MNKILTAFLFCVSNAAFLQMSLDLQLNGSYIMNGPKYDHTDSDIEFTQQNGFAHGFALDFRIKPTVGIHYSFRTSRCAATVTHMWPTGPNTYEAGMLKDRAMTLGIIKEFNLAAGFSTIANVGVYMNPFRYDADNRTESYSVAGSTEVTTNSHSTVTEYARIGGLTFGPGLGIGLEKSFEHFGKFYLGIGYFFDLSKGSSRNIDSDIFSYSTSLTGAGTTILLDQELIITNSVTRNLFYLDIGFKMPGSILFKQKEKKAEEKPQSME